MLGRHRETGQSLPQALDHHTGVSNHRQPGELVGIEGGDVDVHELDVGMGECGLRDSGHVGPPGADADHEIGFLGHLERPRHPVDPE